MHNTYIKKIIAWIFRMVCFKRENCYCSCKYIKTYRISIEQKKFQIKMSECKHFYGDPRNLCETMESTSNIYSSLGKFYFYVFACLLIALEVWASVSQAQAKTMSFMPEWLQKFLGSSKMTVVFNMCFTETYFMPQNPPSYISSIIVSAGLKIL
jgi:glucan phosphoethanolaminetransferase (alkaline phosphatase superfamily)